MSWYKFETIQCDVVRKTYLKEAGSEAEALAFAAALCEGHEDAEPVERDTDHGVPMVCDEEVWEAGPPSPDGEPRPGETVEEFATPAEAEAYVRGAEMVNDSALSLRRSGRRVFVRDEDRQDD